MKLAAFSLLLLLCAPFVAADDSKPLLITPGKVVAEPSLKEPLDAAWSVQKGTWEVQDGEMIVSELPAEKHSAVLWHKVGLQSAAIECEFMFDGAGSFIIGCDGAKHIGRVTITRGMAKITEDSTEVKGAHPGATLGETKLTLKPGEWHRARFEWTGDKMAARIDGIEIQSTHPTLSAAKSRWWFAVGGAKLHLRNVKAWSGDTP